MRRALRGAKWTVLGALAVMLSVAALSVLQYRSLLELEAKTRTAARENLRQAAHTVIARVETQIQHVATDALLGFRGSDLDARNTEILGAQFQAIRRRHREVGEVFAFSLCSCGRDPFAIFSTSTGAGWVKCQRFDEKRVRNALEAYRIARPFPARGRSGAELLFAQGPAGLYAYRILSGDLGKRDQTSFAGILVTAASLVEELVPLAIADAGGNNVVLTITDEGRTLFSNYANERSGEVAAGFGALLPAWEITAAYRGVSIESLAGQQFRRNLLLAVMVLGVLGASTMLMLRAAAREARLAELKSTFVSNVSHEMKTPLALIRMFAETLEMGRVKDQSKIQEYYRVIHKESRRLTHLIDSILDFAAMEAGHRKYDFVPGDVAAIVEGVVASYREQIVGAGFELAADIAPGLPAALIDPNALSEAVLNLLGNAAKYSAEVKAIKVRVSAKDGWIAVEVRDRGIGIPKSEHQRIFEKFYRVGTGLVHDVKGSGLGLTLARHVVKAHGGRILVDSTPGHGSVFTILLPAAVQPQVQPEWAVGEDPVAEGVDHRG